MTKVTNISRGPRSFHDEKGRVHNLLPGQSVDNVTLNTGGHKLLTRMKGSFEIDGQSGGRRQRAQAGAETQPNANTESPEERSARAKALADSLENEEVSYESGLQDGRELLGDNWSFGSKRPSRSALVDALRAV